MLYASLKDDPSVDRSVLRLATQQYPEKIPAYRELMQRLRFTRLGTLIEMLCVGHAGLYDNIGKYAVPEYAGPITTDDLDAFYVRAGRMYPELDIFPLREDIFGFIDVMNKGDYILLDADGASAIVFNCDYKVSDNCVTFNTFVSTLQNKIVMDREQLIWLANERFSENVMGAIEIISNIDDALYISSEMMRQMIVLLSVISFEGEEYEAMSYEVLHLIGVLSNYLHIADYVEVR